MRERQLRCEGERLVIRRHSFDPSPGRAGLQAREMRTIALGYPVPRLRRSIPAAKRFFPPATQFLAFHHGNRVLMHSLKGAEGCCRTRALKRRTTRTMPLIP